MNPFDDYDKDGLPRKKQPWVQQQPTYQQHQMPGFQQPQQPGFPQPQVPPMAMYHPGQMGIPPESFPSDRNRVLAAILAFFLGTLGVHNFYIGQTQRGVAQLVMGAVGYFLTSTLIGAIIGLPLLFALGLWVLIDFILIVVGQAKDGDGRKI